MYLPIPTTDTTNPTPRMATAPFRKATIGVGGTSSLPPLYRLGIHVQDLQLLRNRIKHILFISPPESVPIPLCIIPTLRDDELGGSGKHLVLIPQKQSIGAVRHAVNTDNGIALFKLLQQPTWFRLLCVKWWGWYMKCQSLNSEEKGFKIISPIPDDKNTLLQDS